MMAIMNKKHGFESPKSNHNNISNNNNDYTVHFSDNMNSNDSGNSMAEEEEQVREEVEVNASASGSGSVGGEASQSEVPSQSESLQDLERRVVKHSEKSLLMMKQAGGTIGGGKQTKEDILHQCNSLQQAVSARGVVRTQVNELQQAAMSKGLVHPAGSHMSGFSCGGSSGGGYSCSDVYDDPESRAMAKAVRASEASTPGITYVSSHGSTHVSNEGITTHMQHSVRSKDVLRTSVDALQQAVTSKGLIHVTPPSCDSRGDGGGNISCADESDDLESQAMAEAIVANEACIPGITYVLANSDPGEHHHHQPPQQHHAVMDEGASAVSRRTASHQQDDDLESQADAMTLSGRSQLSTSSPAGIVQLPAFSVSEHSESRAYTSMTVQSVTDHSTLVEAELAPDLEAIMAERDELRKRIESIPHAEAKALSPDDGAPRRSSSRRMAACCLGGRRCLFLLAALTTIALIVAGVCIAIFLGNGTETTPTADSSNNSNSTKNENPNDPFWTSKQVGQTIWGAEAFGEFGEYLSISADGQVLAVGGEEHGGFVGRVVVYQLQEQDKEQEHVWNPVGQEMLGQTPAEESAHVAISSNTNPQAGIGTLAIGGMRATVGSEEQAGLVRTFRLSSSNESSSSSSPSFSWDSIGQVLEGRHTVHRFGTDVQASADGTIIAVGSAGARFTQSNQGKGTAGADVGSVQVFQYNETTDRWNQLGQELTGDNESDFFGFAIALSADGLVVAGGGYGYNANGERSGIVRVFEFDQVSSLWKQRGKDFYGEAALDEVGRSVSLSSDGRTIAYGAYRHSTIDAEEVGRVYVYKWPDDDDGNGSSGGEWLQVGPSIDGFETLDRLGRAVTLSGDGSVLAAGAYWNNDGGARAGHVRVFYLDNATTDVSWEQVGPPIIGDTGDWFGRHLAMSRDGKTLAIGGPFNTNPMGDKSGKVEVYSLP